MRFWLQALIGQGKLNGCQGLVFGQAVYRSVNSEPLILNYSSFVSVQISGRDSGWLNEVFRISMLQRGGPQQVEENAASGVSGISGSAFFVYELLNQV